MQYITNVPMHSNGTSSATHKCTNALAEQWLPHHACPVDTVAGSTRIQTLCCHRLWEPAGFIFEDFNNFVQLYFILCVLFSDHRWRAFFQNSLFTWSSFHVYGSLLSNQIEASNAHKNWIVWHLSLKTNICMENQHRCLVVCFIVRRCKKRMYESTDLMMSHKPR